MLEMNIRPYYATDEDEVIKLWVDCNLTRPWNNPKQDIQRKLRVNPELFLVGLVDAKIVSTAMGGYEGHRDWVNYLAVALLFQRQGLGRQMMKAIEEKLLIEGCPKVNLQIRTGNIPAIEFYQRIGYKTDDAISMGKRLIEDI